MGNNLFRDKSRKTIGVDFDGVIHSYTSKWTTPTEIHDGPVPGAIKFLNGMAGQFNVAIISARAQDPNAIQPIKDWLVLHGVDEDFIMEGYIQVTSTKVGAVMYIDDRGYHFTGTFPSPEDIWAFKPWNRSDL